MKARPTLSAPAHTAGAARAARKRDRKMALEGGRQEFASTAQQGGPELGKDNRCRTSHPAWPLEAAGRRLEGNRRRLE